MDSNQVFLCPYHKYSKINRFRYIWDHGERLMINIGPNFRILKNFGPNPRCAPPGYISGNLFHKPDLIALSELLIHVGYKLGIQNIYTLPMSGSCLLGAIGV